MVNIPGVQFELALPTQAVPPVYLGPAGHARAHLVAARLCLGITRQVCGRQRTWSDKRHIPAQHVPQLGQFIQAGAAQEASPTRQALVVTSGARPHGAEFQDGERAFAQARPFLSKKDRSTVA